jgi:hypothetical protein
MTRPRGTGFFASCSTAESLNREGTTRSRRRWQHALGGGELHLARAHGAGGEIRCSGRPPWEKQPAAAWGGARRREDGAEARTAERASQRVGNYYKL